MKQRVHNLLDRVGNAGPGFSRRAFTLLEALIAVAALGLLAVGLAQIFDATGKTVTAGRRVSAFNAYASLIEQQLRNDISRMTREGFLVIRHEYADRTGEGVITLPGSNQITSVDSVPLFDGDERARMRRIDELMFFAKGEFVSARASLHPEFTAKADAARIYFGHGQRARQPVNPPATPPNDPYYLPELNGDIWGTSNIDLNGRLGYNSTATPPNPNAFASEWILLRHVTLLTPPRTSPFYPSSQVFGYAPNNPILQDSDSQIALQPALSHIFRGLSGYFPTTLPPLLRPNPRPSSDSGLVDIAATSLPLIRSVVTTASKFPNQIGNRFFDPNANASPNEFTQNEGADGVFTRWGSAGNVDQNVIARMQSWMMDAMPANSMALNATDRRRVRCDLSPRNYLGALDTTQWASDLEAAYRAADQVMLTSSNFLPRCTEFIVEWSFGKTWPSDPVTPNSGQLIWHGMTRRTDNATVAVPYDDRINEYRAQEAFTRVNGSTGQHDVSTLLIHGVEANRLPVVGAPIASHFGYVDPSFDPDANNDGDLNDSNDSMFPTIPWAWPKLIRVTLSLADPADPTIERTYQFVFQVPDDGV